MHKITPFLILMLFLSSCTIDWNDEKDKKIAELEKQVTVLKEKNNDELFKKKLECQEKYEEIYGPGTREYYSNINIEIFYSEIKNSCLLRFDGWKDNERLFIISDILAQTRLISFGVDKDWHITQSRNLEGDLTKLKCDFNFKLEELGGESYFRDIECQNLLP